MLSDGLNEFNFNETGFRATLQLANSARVLYSAIEDIDESEDFFYGELLIGNLLGVVPMAQSVYLNLTDTKKYELSSSQYLTYIKFGEDSVHGEGTTIIADIYLNFGYVGVLVVMFLFGIFYKKVNFELHLKRSHYWVIIAAIVGSYSIYMGRSNLLHPLKYIVWSIPITFLLVKKKRTTHT
jgi:oligosaccharide repeat unit polymerase